MKKYSIIFLANLLVLFLAYETQAYQNPIGYNSITEFAEGILASIQGLVGWLAVIFIVIGGIIYITAGGDNNRITLAKNTITASLIGFSIAVAGPSLLREIKDLVQSTGGATSIDNATSLRQILDNVLSFALIIVGILSLGTLVYSGFLYLGAGRDNSKIEQAKNLGVYSIMALAISGGSLIIVKTVLNFLGIST